MQQPPDTQLVFQPTQQKNYFQTLCVELVQPVSSIQQNHIDMF